MALVPITTRPRQPSGLRDRPVTIEQGADAVAGSGMPTQTWSRLGFEFMSKIDLDSTERLRTGQISAPLTSVFEMPYREDMDPDIVNVPKARRLVYQGKVYNITGATQIGRREGIELLTVATL